MTLHSESQAGWDGDSVQAAALGGSAVVAVRPRPHALKINGGYERWLKPMVDRVAAAVLLLVLLPVLVAVAATVRLHLGSPVILRQDRVGRYGRPFRMYKFRTMHPDRRSGGQPYDGPERRICHKTDDDPRHTSVGRLLRRWSLDELPQLANVVAGHMSLVGPRPELTQIVRQYEPWQHQRHQVKPGVTGLWQVTERGNGTLMHEHIEVDLEYLERVSLATDVKILLRTIPAAFGSRRGS